jgi:hypothetical protein
MMQAKRETVQFLRQVEQADTFEKIEKKRKLKASKISNADYQDAEKEADGKDKKKRFIRQRKLMSEIVTQANDHKDYGDTRNVNSVLNQVCLLFKYIHLLHK